MPVGANQGQLREVPSDLADPGGQGVPEIGAATVRDPECVQEVPAVPETEGEMGSAPESLAFQAALQGPVDLLGEQEDVGRLCASVQDTGCGGKAHDHSFWPWAGYSVINMSRRFRS